MRKLLLLCFLAAGLHVCAQDYSRAKIIADQQGLQRLMELGIAIDHGQIKRDTWIVSDFSADELELARQNGFGVEILIADVQEFYRNQNSAKPASDEQEKNTDCTQTNGSSYTQPANPSHWNHGSMGGFLTYQQFLDEVDEMAATYPNLITTRAPISTFTSIEGRSIYWMRISDNPNTDENEPEVLYTAVHHAREPNSLSEVIFYMWHLLENYGTDPEITYLVDSTEMYFVPMVNPDGYIYNETTDPNGGGMWRKNRRQNSGGSYGVDVNRNYSYGWNTTGVSTQQSGETWPGTAAFSEPETQAMKWFCENRDFKYAFNSHTYGNDLLHPIGTTTAEYAADHAYFEAFTHHMVKYNGYAALKSSALYPASGDSDDYMYKVDTVVKPKIFSMTPEVSSSSGGFWPAESEIDDICRGMVFPNMVLAHLTHNYYVIGQTDPGSIGTTTGYFHHQTYRLGLGTLPVSISITPLTGIASVGSGVSHQTAIMVIDPDSISFVLNSNIQYGDEIKYVLVSDFGGWIKRDTIVKLFGELESQFTDDATAAANWTGNWATTTSTYVSPSASFTDSPSGDYANSTNKTWAMNQTIDLTTATAASARFWAKWDIEQGYDYVQFQVSTNGGTSWQAQCGLYTGNGSTLGGAQPEGAPLWDAVQANWVREEINLSQYLGQQIKVRFVLKSDSGTTGDGFYFDDFEILYDEPQTGLGLTEENINSNVYPNPANSYLNVALANESADNTVSLAALDGKIVKSQSYEGLTNKLLVNTSELTNGVYELLVSSNGQLVSRSN